MYNEWGTKLITADGEATSAAVPTRVQSVHILSGGGGAAVVSFKNNGSGGTTFLTETGVVSTGKTIYYGMDGVLFPSGCYVDVDANTTSVALVCRTVN
jgi:hypothetical protein